MIVDIWPRDRASRCWADMTRTFIAGGGEPPDELAEYWRLTRESLDRSFAEVRAGADGRRSTASRASRTRTPATRPSAAKPAGAKLDEGYYHSLGHGVGLEVHERPNLGRTPDTLMAGDVITLEPGCYGKAFGGVPARGPRARARGRLPSC